MSRFLHTLRILAATLHVQLQAERAYLGDFWAKIASPLLYNISFLFFVDLLFRRFDSIADYSRNDFIFLMFVSQIGFYIGNYFMYWPLSKMVEWVRMGSFDLMLLKPVATKTFLYANGIRPTYAAFMVLPNLALVSCFINWTALDVTLLSVLTGLLIFGCGVIMLNTLLFALTLPVFKGSDATDMLNTYFSTAVLREIPYSKMPEPMKILSLFALPILIAGAGAVDVILSKGHVSNILLPVLAAAAISLILYRFLWKYALRNYTSASS